MYNPWHDIPLQDYESHMSHPSVGQLELISRLAQQALAEYQPETFCILGVAGGNGLEHVNPALTRHTIGIDVHRGYLDVCWQRFGNRLPGLQLICCDLNRETPDINPVDLFWAALIFEYVDMETILQFISAGLKGGGRLIALVQQNNGVGAVSPTGIESVKKAGEVFRIVDIEALKQRGLALRLHCRDASEFPLLNGKSLIRIVFQKEKA